MKYYFILYIICKMHYNKINVTIHDRFLYNKERTCTIEKAALHMQEGAYLWGIM